MARGGAIAVSDTGSAALPNRSSKARRETKIGTRVRLRLARRTVRS